MAGQSSLSSTVEAPSWSARPYSEKTVLTLVRHLAISPWLARILVARGIESPDQARVFLHPELQPFHDPLSLPGIEPFLARMESAAKNKERVIIHGDYDADGVTSAAILQFAFRGIGLDPVVHLPNRFEAGYGIQPDWVEGVKAEGFDLIVSTDCGSSAKEACLRAKTTGIDLIVTDHHTPLPDLEGPLAHINPHLPHSAYPFQKLCGAGVAFKLAQALARLVPASFQARYREEIPVDLAMIGTLADVMPLVDENRRIVVDGLDRLRRMPTPGLRAMLESARCDPTAVNVETIAFQIAPRLNAAGRLRDPILAFNLLTATEPSRIRALAQELEGINEERKKLATLAEGAALVRLNQEPPEGAVVLADPDWHRGLLGILAAKLLDATGLPVFLGSIEGDRIHGSARVPTGFNAAEILHAVADHTESGGGHAGAAGFTVMVDHWEEFVQAVKGAVLHSDAEACRPELPIDAFVSPTADLEELLREAGQLEPFGEGFGAPVLAVCRFEGRGRTLVFGKNNLKINLGTAQRPLEAIGFRMADWAKDLERQSVDVAIEYGVNHWNGKTAIRPKILAIRPSLKEKTECGRREEVARLEAEDGAPSLVVWDARGADLLSAEHETCLRVGYGPDWKTWWYEAAPGTATDWKSKGWEMFPVLPAEDWPAGCCTAYGGEIPQEWNGEAVEVLWPPLRKQDRRWLRSVLASAGNDCLVRLAFREELLKDWLSYSLMTPTRADLATFYRSVPAESDSDIWSGAALPPIVSGLCLEILIELEVLRLESGRVKKNPSPVKREMSESRILAEWKRHGEMMERWLEQAARLSGIELVRRWMREG